MAILGPAHFDTKKNLLSFVIIKILASCQNLHSCLATCQNFGRISYIVTKI